MVRRHVVVDWRRDGRTQYIHEIEEFLVLRTSILTVADLTNGKSLRTTNRPSQAGQTVTFVRIAAGDPSVGC